MSKTLIISDTVRRISERILGGHELKYDKEIHVDLLIELFDQGHDIAAFCVAAEVCFDTFYDWIAKHPEFKKAYTIAKGRAYQWWLEQGRMGMNDPSFNVAMWSKIMGNRFRFSDSRRIKVKKLKDTQTPKQQYDVVVNEVAEGDLTVAEVSQLTKLIDTGVRVIEHTVLADEVKEIKEELERRK